MTSLTSQLNEAEDALLALIQARAAQFGSALAGVRMQLGNPASRLPRECIWIGESTDAQHQGELTGSDRTDREDLTLQVHLYVAQAGDNFTRLRDRCSALSEEIEAAVRADPTIGGVVWDATVTSINRQTGALERGRAAEVTVTVSAVAYLAA